MGHTPLLYLALDGLHAYRQDKSTHTTEHGEHFAPEPAGQQAFARWLEGLAPRRSFTILIDLPDERFRIEQVPHVRGPDRRHLRERRQDQLFPDTPFVTHQYLDRDRSGRQDERIVFMALTRPALIRPWLDAIDAAGHAVKRLLPISTLSTALAPRGPSSSGPSLIALHTPAGLRVSCIDGTRLLFSRLSPAPPTGHAMSAAAEILLTHQHLLSQRTLTQDSPCTSFIIGNAIDAQAPVAPPDASGLTIMHVDIGQLAHQNGTCIPSGKHDSLGLLLSLAAKPLVRRLPHCGPASAFRTHYLHKTGNAILGFGFACMCACLAWSFVEFREAEQVRIRTQQSVVGQQRIASELALRQAALQKQPSPPASAQALVDHLSTLQPTAGPALALHALANALAPLPAVDIQRIDWTSAPSTRPSTPTNGNIEALIVEFLLPDGAERLHDRASLSSRIASALRTMTGAQVTVERLPAELDPSLTVRATDLHAPREAPVLGIRIQLPTQP